MESLKRRITLFHFSFPNQNEKQFKFRVFIVYLSKILYMWGTPSPKQKELPIVSPRQIFIFD